MALAVDWVTSNLYWSSSQKPSLHVTSPLGSYTTLLLQGALKVTAAHLNCQTTPVWLDFQLIFFFFS